MKLLCQITPKNKKASPDLDEAFLYVILLQYHPVFQKGYPPLAIGNPLK